MSAPSQVINLKTHKTNSYDYGTETLHLEFKSPFSKFLNYKFFAVHD